MKKAPLLPRRVRVGAQDYTFVRLPDDSSDFGWCDLDELQIGLMAPVRYATPGQMVETVLHELKHAIWKAGSLKESDDEERIISVLSHGLVQVFRDNPRLVRWMQAHLK